MTAAANTVRLHRVLRAPAERIYRAFLDPDALCRWLPPYGYLGKIDRIDPQVGGPDAVCFIHDELASGLETGCSSREGEGNQEGHESEDGAFHHFESSSLLFRMVPHLGQSKSPAQLEEQQKSNDQ